MPPEGRLRFPVLAFAVAGALKRKPSGETGRAKTTQQSDTVMHAAVFIPLSSSDPFLKKPKEYQLSIASISDSAVTVIFAGLYVFV
jgi:hypothetical protein